MYAEFLLALAFVVVLYAVGWSIARTETERAKRTESHDPNRRP